jgi:hypothetical protein
MEEAISTTWTKSEVCQAAIREVEKAYGVKDQVIKGTYV